MKKLIMVIMTLLLSLSLVSCTNETTTSSNEGEKPAQETKNEDQKSDDNKSKPEQENQDNKQDKKDNDHKEKQDVKTKDTENQKSEDKKPKEETKKPADSKKPPKEEKKVSEKKEDSTDKKPEENKEAETVSEEDKIPEFTFLDLDGNEHNIRDYEGKITLVNFWATTCSWCKKEMPSFDDLAKNDSDVKVIPISVGDSVEAINSFKDKNKISMDMYMDKDMKVASEFGITGFPTTLFIDSDGRFVGAVPGYLPDDKLKEIISKIKDKSIYENNN